jgi:hypothetical protein
MKHVFALILTFFAASVNGQILKSVGIKSGLSIANQNWDFDSYIITSMDTKSRNGIFVATSFEFFNSKYLSLITDLSYCEKGSTEQVLHTVYDTPGAEPYETFDTKLSYFSISPMLKIRYESVNLIPYALLGLRIDYQLNYVSDLDYFRIDNNINKTIFGANFGAGLEYNAGQFGIFVEGNYQYDFNKVTDTDQSWNGPGIKINNKAFIICAGLKYNLRE